MTNEELIKAAREYANTTEARRGVAWDSFDTALLRTLADALENASPQWRPIETAPRDGTPLLLSFDEHPGSRDSRVAIEGRWIAENKMWHPVVLDFHGCGCCGGGDPTPTHWLPLPPPPKSDEVQ